MFSQLKLMTSTLLLGAIAYGGGYWLEFGNPKTSSDLAAKDAIALVRSLGCGEPYKSTVKATAEGLVRGERKSIPLQVVPLSTPGIYALKGDLPADGVWAVSATGNYREAEAGVIALVTPNGFDRKTAKFSQHKPLASDIDALLRGRALPKQSAAR
jgi:hypothetical protein